jgi:hypothetical protein
MKVYYSNHLIRQEKVRFFWHLTFLSRIRDPGSGSRIRDKHPGSALLDIFIAFSVFEGRASTDCTCSSFENLFVEYQLDPVLQIRIRDPVPFYPKDPG